MYREIEMSEMYSVPSLDNDWPLLASRNSQRQRFTAGFAGQHSKQERGCLSCTNSLVAVPQDKYYAIERVGKFVGMLNPGLAWAGLDCLGCCISFRSITSRVTQVEIHVKTKTKEHVFVTLRIAVQMTVHPYHVMEAMYKLSNVRQQVESFVSDVVRSELPKMTLTEVFERKDQISDAVHRHLHGEMRDYGYSIIRALVTDVSADREVVNAITEMCIARYGREATKMVAEAQQIRMLRSAEANADAAEQQGLGIARQRSAILAGLQEAVEQGAEERTMTNDELTRLLILTQYFDTVKEIGEKSDGHVVFIPHHPEVIAETTQQVCEALDPSEGALPITPSPSQQRMR